MGNQFRIGNYTKLGKVIRLDEDTATIKTSSDGEWHNKLDFIPMEPLTEEWLEKFGFSDITEHCAVKVRNQKEFCISFFVGNCTEQQTMFVTIGSKGWIFKRIGSPLYKYVHQLQNLYFALTGEELILKEQ